MNRSKVRALTEGGVVFLIGLMILLLIPSQVEKPLGVESRTPPSFLPRVISICLLLSGAGLVVQAFLRTQTGGTPAILGGERWRILLSVGLLGGYAFLFPRLGFVSTSAVIMGVFTYLFGSRSWTRILLSMILVPLGAWLFLEVIFAIPLPRGALF
jgi:hypothetical protein